METAPIRTKPFLEKRRVVLLRMQLLEHGGASTLFHLRVHIEGVDRLREHRGLAAKCPACVCVCVGIPAASGLCGQRGFGCVWREGAQCDGTVYPAVVLL